MFPAVQASRGNNASNPTNDDDLPTALRKGTRSCTNHPIQDYVSFGNLSSEYHAFVSKLDKSSPEPKIVHEALQVPDWRAAIQ